jgi:1-pyrroline-5-carboxylate dehydrogenase
MIFSFLCFSPCPQTAFSDPFFFGSHQQRKAAVSTTTRSASRVNTRFTRHVIQKRLMNTRSVIGYPANEPILEYKKGTPERDLLVKAIAELRANVTEIPVVINGKQIKTGKLGEQHIPHDHKHVLARYHQAGPAEVQAAIDASLKARAEWAAMPMDHRLAIFLKAADLLSGPWRYKLLAATILGQSKNYYQAEIDTICEVCTLPFRF